MSAIDYNELYDINISGKTARCKFCPHENIYKFHRFETGYSTLKRHSETKHQKEFENAKLIEKSTPPISSFFNESEKLKESEPSRLAELLCCSQHVLPINWADDPIVREILQIKTCSKTVRS